MKKGFKTLIAGIVLLVIGGFAFSVLVGLAGTGLMIWGIVKLATDKGSA